MKFLRCQRQQLCVWVLEYLQAIRFGTLAIRGVTMTGEWAESFDAGHKHYIYVCFYLSCCRHFLFLFAVGCIVYGRFSWQLQSQRQYQKQNENGHDKRRWRTKSAVENLFENVGCWGNDHLVNMGPTGGFQSATKCTSCRESPEKPALCGSYSAWSNNLLVDSWNARQCRPSFRLSMRILFIFLPGK